MFEMRHGDNTECCMGSGLRLVSVMKRGWVVLPELFILSVDTSGSRPGVWSLLDCMMVFADGLDGKWWRYEEHNLCEKCKSPNEVRSLASLLGMAPNGVAPCQELDRGLARCLATCHPGLPILVMRCLTTTANVAWEKKMTMVYGRSPGQCT